MCLDCNLNDNPNIGELYQQVIRACDDERLDKLRALEGTVNPTKKEVKVIFDRIFNQYNSFLRMLEKEGGEYSILSLMFRKFDYKRALFDNADLKRIYDEL